MKTEIDWPFLLKSMSELASKLGTERAQKVFDCLKDLHSTLDKYDDDIRESALRFVFELSNQFK